MPNYFWLLSLPIYGTNYICLRKALKWKTQQTASVMRTQRVQQHGAKDPDCALWKRSFLCLQMFQCVHAAWEPALKLKREPRWALRFQRFRRARAAASPFNSPEQHGFPSQLSREFQTSLGSRMYRTVVSWRAGLKPPAPSADQTNWLPSLHRKKSFHNTPPPPHTHTSLSLCRYSDHLSLPFTH